jgi:hypothetical protein
LQTSPCKPGLFQSTTYHFLKGVWIFKPFPNFFLQKFTALNQGRTDMRTLLTGLLLLLNTFLLFSQEKDPSDFQEQYRLHISKSSGPITIDGLLNEGIWNKLSAATDFWEKWPNDKDKAKRKTEVKITYDNLYLYIGVAAYDSNYYIIQTLKRDNGMYDSDAFSIAIDPVNQRTNGFLFSLTPYNVQSEDLVSGGNFNEPNFSWDNKWFSATKRHDYGWTGEIAIPFKTLRYETGKKIWGINFLRSDLKNNQYSSWTHVPVNFNFYDFGYSGALIWDEPPPPPGTNLSFIPFVTGSVSEDKEEGKPIKGKFNAGFDAKVALTSSLNLDLTMNPDFSQIEVDRQVTNLTRFNIFFPERRTFFLENDDLFSQYAIPPIRPFYSRRIGLDKDGNTIPIIGGARLSGNLTKKMRIGVMNMQTLKKGDFAAQNYTAVSVNQRIQNRSLIKGYFLNRQAFMNDEQKQQEPLDAFGRNAGIEYNYSDKKGNWNGWAGYHVSYKPGINHDNHFLNGGGGYFSKNFIVVLDLDEVKTNYYADMGFIARIENYDAKKDSTYRMGFRQVFNEMTLQLYPKDKKVTQHNIGMENFTVFNLNGTLNERSNELGYEIRMRNTSSIEFGISNNAVNLAYHTGFTDDDKYEPLPPGKYNYTLTGIEYNSDSRKNFIVEAEANYGGFYNGKLFQSRLALTYRIQPWGNFTLNIENADIRFPSPHGKTNLFLVAPRIEINFSNSMFWTTFLQYNTQRNNFNINSRFQWRFKPMSDLFVVYTDNYFTDPLFKNKNRALVFKMNYWLNL